MMLLVVGGGLDIDIPLFVFSKSECWSIFMFERWFKVDHQGNGTVGVNLNWNWDEVF